MSLGNDSRSTRIGFGLVLVATIVLAGCGGGSSSSSPPPTAPVRNTTSAVVDIGPANNSTNMLFVTVTVCMPGSTTNCQSIDNIQVDTGSEGLRILSSALGNLDPSSGNGLPTVKDSSNNILQECVQFADTSYAWGPVAAADVSMAEENGSSVPIQVISATPAFSVPSSCLRLGTGGPSLNTVTALGANGIIGLGVFPDDCGGACGPTSSNVPNQYYVCPSGACSVARVAETSQVANPVVYFPSDNNGVLVTMPSIDAAGAATATGSLTFGIGTQSDNALGSASVFTVDDYGEFTSTYNGVQYPAILDAGSNALYFLDYVTLGIPDCGGSYGGWYCPSSTQNYTVTNLGTNGTTGQASFSIANTLSLFSNSTFTAFNNLGGDSGTGVSTDMVDLGMPFFYGRSVFVGIMGQTAPSNAANTYGYFAY